MRGGRVGCVGGERRPPVLRRSYGLWECVACSDELRSRSHHPNTVYTHGANGDGTVIYTPDADWYGNDTLTYTISGFAGDDSFQYTLSDGDPTTADATATVNVTVQAVPSTLEYTSTTLPINIGDLKTVSSRIGN
jgi:hypothetical protein